MAEDLLGLPSVPEPKPEDSEDVSWALSTAEAMWARGDHAEGIKWLRKAAEAASDADQDVRALELAKAASDLASLLARRSAPEGGAVASPPVPVPAKPVAASPSPSNAPSPPRASATPPKPLAPRSSPPLPSKASQTPPAPASSSPSKAPRPLAATSSRPQAPVASRADARRKRRSRENLEDEVRIASLPDPPKVEERETARDVTANDKTIEVPALQMQTPIDRTFESTVTPAAPRRRRSRPDDAPPGAASSRPGAHPPGDGLTPSAPPAAPTPVRQASEWDSSPTQALSSADLEEMAAQQQQPAEVTGDRMTSIAAAPPAPQSSPRPPAKTVHDEGIRTSQAVRVVVWRDGNGVHVAPAGTVVSAITVDAVLVALEPSADLTAWLSRRDR